MRKTKVLIVKGLCAALLLLATPAVAQNSGPAPQTGLDHPEITRGARESGAMKTVKSKAATDKKKLKKGGPKGR